MKSTITLFTTIFLLTTFNLLTSCNKDDDNNKNELQYSAKLEKVCRDDGTYYCITKQEYTRIREYIASIPPNEPCIWISITDINNGRHSGYLRSTGAGSNSSICN